MPQVIKLKRSATAGQVPGTNQLDLGEMAINTNDGRVYFKKNDGTEAVYELNTRQNEGYFDKYMDFNTTEAIKLPVGTTGQRPTGANLKQGSVRYNTSDSTFEGYDGVNWGSLGGVKDVNQDTYITTENSPGSNEDTMTFYGGSTVANSGNVGVAGNMGTWNNSMLTVNTDASFNGDVTFTGAVTIPSGYDTTTDDLFVDGNTRLGDAETDTLTVNATSTFEAAADFNNSVNIDGVFTTTGNTTLGNAAADTLTVNATTDFINGVTMSGNLTIESGDSFTFGQGANRVAFTDTRRMTVSNEAGTIIFDGRIFVA